MTAPAIRPANEPFEVGVGDAVGEDKVGDEEGDEEPELDEFESTKVVFVT
jgi:hypothetical protein